MKVIYEFNVEVGNDSNDEWDLKIFQNAHRMYEALNNISDYLRQLRKGWVEDDLDTIEDKISDMVIDSNIGEIE